MLAPFIPPQHSSARQAVYIRVLATTDLHGHLLPYDYIKDRPTQGGGLAGLARLIAEARAQAASAGVPVVLLDNGDTFQGTPLASYLADRNVTPDHPIVAALNHLAYDAIGLGNHDLDHGLPYLKALARALNMPILNSNLHGNDIAPLRQSLLVPLDIGPEAPAPLTLGVLSLLPEQSAAWQSQHLSAQTTLEPPSAAVSTYAADLRKAGADLVIVLAHLGVGHADHPTPAGQAAHAVASTGQIDALVLGHTHRRLPSGEYAGRNGVDLQQSTLGGIPTVMAGHTGSDLGVIDLALGHDADRGWYVAGHRCTLRPNGANVIPDPTISEISAPTHKAVRAALSAPVATLPHDMHSYFSLVAPAPTQRLVARAQELLVTRALAGTTLAELPVLSAAAAFGAGGRDGPENYIFVPKGAVLKRHIAGLNIFANQTIGIRITGSELKAWLEHAALIFNTLQLGGGPQLLADPNIPAFQFDTIYGLETQIDPTAKPYNRIRQLHYDGRPVVPEQQFILATNQFRSAGGGGYPAIPPDRVVVRSPSSLEEAIIATLQTSSPQTYDSPPPWQFAPLGGIEAIFMSHSDALNYLADISHLSPRLSGTTPEGFIRLSVHL